MKYKFEEPLVEGIIKSRPNRFIMFVQINENKNTLHRQKEIKCHCPSTGRIGNVKFENIPCLLSKADTKGRKTPYTVEAISFNSPKSKNKKWIGINQVKMNSYVYFFFQENQFTKMIKNGKDIEKEKTLGKSRIDFKAEQDYIEVKMPLISLPTPKKNSVGQIPSNSNFDSFDRLIKHFGDLSKSIKKGSRAIVLLCYQYDAKPFSPPQSSNSNLKVLRAAKKANKKGVENWQANFRINKTGVELREYFKLGLFK